MIFVENNWSTSIILIRVAKMKLYVNKNHPIDSKMKNNEEEEE
jgi:hypothetical protein